MKHGIYYAYWEQEWKADYRIYIKKVAKLGFDILEIAATPLVDYSDNQLAGLKKCARDNGLILTVNHGPSPEQNLSSADPGIRKNAKAFFTDLLQRINKLDAHTLGGALFSYWPIDYTKKVNKEEDWNRSVEGIRQIAKVAGECGVYCCLEVLNRFENYLLNTSSEGVEFVKQVDHPNIKLLLDTFHMNIEEDSIGGAIRTAGDHLGHLHTGECNRKVPGKGRIPWREIGQALNDIQYDGNIVMEPFVKMGGTVGSDIKIWRDLSSGANEEKMDEDALNALIFSRYMLG
jgi:D-psicose/D-tagatose/L-ribulose 3-epimerase